MLVQRDSSRTTLFLVLITLVLLASTMTACEDGLGALLISDAQELEMGQGVDQQIEAEYPILADNDPITTWARELVNPLINASQEFRQSDGYGGYKVEVIADTELVNAFAAPGGYTYLSMGLIMQASSCAEIAGVMGHELAHVTERHSSNAIAENFAIGTVADFIFGGGSFTGEAAKLVYGFLTSTSFSQDNESEADIVGMQIAFNSGYNPYGLVDFFETLLALEQQSGGNLVPQFLSSHPATDERIATISAEIERRYSGQVVRGQTQSYKCFGTSMTLDQVKASISGGNFSVKAGTGTGSP